MTQDILKALSIFSGLLPIVLFLVFLRRNKEGKLWVIFLYAIFSFLTDVGFSVIPEQAGSAEFYLYSLFTIVEFSFFAIFIFLQIKSRTIKWLIAISGILFYGYALYNIINSPNKTFDSRSASVESVLVIFFCILFFFEQMRNPEISFIYSSKVFWITTAVLLYLAATLFLFISTEYFTMQERETYWSINFISNILKNILLSIAFILPKHKSPPLDRDPYNKAFAPPFN